MPKCPECGSSKNWKDGTRETKFGSVQRFICRNCSFRFSERCSKCGAVLIDQDQEMIPLTVDCLRAAFPEDQKQVLSFEDKGANVILKHWQFLESEEVFIKIADRIYALGGEYVRAGKTAADSYFKIPFCIRCLVQRCEVIPVV